MPTNEQPAPRMPGDPGHAAEMSQQPQQRQPATRDTMPWYECHKRVQALKIQSIERDINNAASVRTVKIFFVDGMWAPAIVPDDIVARYVPVAGDYYVLYEDGYASFSPAAAFESGYTIEKA